MRGLVDGTREEPTGQSIKPDSALYTPVKIGIRQVTTSRRQSPDHLKRDCPQLRKIQKGGSRHAKHAEAGDVNDTNSAHD